MSKTYHILLDERHPGMCSGVAEITEEGAKKIYSAYETQNGENCQSMDKRESRGGICWLSEIKYWKKIKLLPNDFDWKKYEVTQ